MSQVKVKFTADTSNFQKGIGKIKKSIRGIVNASTKAAAALATGGLAAALAGVVAAIGVGFTAIKKAMDFEVLELRMEQLYKSTSKAAKKLLSLKKFAASTPYGLEELSEATMTLKGFADGVLDTEDALQTIGDAAAFAGRGIGEVAEVYGRFWANLQQGGTGQESITRLSEMKLMTSDLAVEIANAATNQEKLKALMDGTKQRSGGSMQKLSGTLKGLISTLKDAWDENLRGFGKGFLEPMKSLVNDLTEWTTKNAGTAKEFGETVSGFIVTAINLFREDQLWAAFKDAIKSAFATVTILLIEAFKTGADYMDDVFEKHFPILAEITKALRSDGFKMLSMQKTPGSVIWDRGVQVKNKSKDWVVDKIGDALGFDFTNNPFIKHERQKRDGTLKNSVDPTQGMILSLNSIISAAARRNAKRAAAANAAHVYGTKPATDNNPFGTDLNEVDTNPFEKVAKAIKSIAESATTSLTNMSGMTTSLAQRGGSNDAANVTHRPDIILLKAQNKLLQQIANNTKASKTGSTQLTLTA